MFKTIKNALKTPEIRKRLMYTLILIVIFRLGCFISVPGIDTVALSELAKTGSNSLSGFIDLISGGAFSRFSIFAMSISPYITASIVIQLLGMVIPSLERLIKEGGEEGRAKVNKYTKIVTLILALVEAIGIYVSYSSTYSAYGVFINPGFGTGALIVLSLVAGTALLMWLGEQITNKGIGNGISIIIFIGIIASLPSAVTTIYRLIITANGFSTTGLLISLGIIIGAIILVAGVVFVQEAERRVPVQYAKKVVGRKMYGGQNTHIPLKLAMAGVMPVIFASTIIAIPQTLANFIKSEGYIKFVNNYLNYNTVVGLIIYLVLIVLFSYIYTLLQFRPADISENLQKNGGYIPGIRPGVETKNYIKSVLIKITTFGSLFLVVIAALPILFSNYSNVQNANITLGGTGILIVVGVALETYKQIESVLTQKEYKRRF